MYNRTHTHKHTHLQTEMQTEWKKGREKTETPKKCIMQLHSANHHVNRVMRANAN